MRISTIKVAAIIFATGIALAGFSYITAPAPTEAANYCDSQGGCTGPSANDWYRPWALSRDSGYRSYRDYTPNNRSYSDYSDYEPYRYDYRYDDDDYRRYDDYDDRYYDSRNQRYDCPRKYRDSERLCKKYRYSEYRYEDSRDRDGDYRYYYEYRYSY